MNDEPVECRVCCHAVPESTEKKTISILVDGFYVLYSYACDPCKELILEAGEIYG